MNIVKQCQSERFHLSSRAEHNICVSTRSVILSGFIFSSRSKCKVELYSTSGYSSNSLITVFNCHSNQSITITLPSPIYLENGVHLKISNIDNQSDEAYITVFYEDDYEAFNRQFTQDLENTIVR